MTNIFKMGTDEDMAIRVTELRIDTKELRARVDQAREYIFLKGKVPNNKWTEDKLKNGLFTAVKVRSTTRQRNIKAVSDITERFLCLVVGSRIQRLRSFRRRFSSRVRIGCVEGHIHTYHTDLVQSKEGRGARHRAEQAASLFDIRDVSASDANLDFEP
jgi:hypothetical protein